MSLLAHLSRRWRSGKSPELDPKANIAAGVFTENSLGLNRCDWSCAGKAAKDQRRRSPTVGEVRKSCLASLAAPFAVAFALAVSNFWRIAAARSCFCCSCPAWIALASSGCRRAAFCSGQRLAPAPVAGGGLRGEFTDRGTRACVVRSSVRTSRFRSFVHSDNCPS